MKVNVLEKHSIYKKIQYVHNNTLKRPCPSVNKFKFDKNGDSTIAAIVSLIDGQPHHLYFIEDWTYTGSFHMIATPITNDMLTRDYVEEISKNVANWLESLKEEYNKRGN